MGITILLFHFCAFMGYTVTFRHWTSVQILSYYFFLKIKIYRTIILPVDLYGCEVWSLTLREERRQRVFENRVLRRIYGPKKDKVIVRIEKTTQRGNY
jgi:hypothetical protein